MSVGPRRFLSVFLLVVFTNQCSIHALEDTMDTVEDKRVEDDDKTSELQTRLEELDQPTGDDRTLLDLFGEATKEFLTQKVVSKKK